MREEVDIHIRNVLTLNPANGAVLKEVDITVKDGKIKEVSRGIKVDAAEVIDGSGKIAIPGFVDAHTHVFQIMLRGALSMKELQVHPIWLRVLIPFEAELTREEAEISAELACLNMIRKGIVSFAEAGGPYPDIEAEAARSVGLRARVTHSTMDAGPENYVRTASMNRELVRKYASGLVRGYYSIRQLMTSTDFQLDETFRFAREDDALVTMHINEEVSEIQHALARWGMRPIEFLHSKGYLCSRLLAAHCAFLSRSEIEILSKCGVNVVHCPTIAMLYMNFPRIPELLSRGVNVALGSDGGSYRPLDIFTEINIMVSGLTGYYGAPYHDHSVLSPVTALKMATFNGAKALGDDAGEIREGALADITIVDARKPHLTPLHDSWLLPLFATGSDVTDLIVDGKLIMRKGEVMTLDEDSVVSRAREIAPQIREKIVKLLRTSH
ncbi:MAG: amidohydrolase family protein [Nitrososphaerota archaeon]|nr:amidohydrolase family protein [Candidatus Calditenuaceae archaeon]MDW8073024.1 amidohydrolase family protein [Nitrososphaerota archaeon]